MDDGGLPAASSSALPAVLGGTIAQSKPHWQSAASRQERRIKARMRAGGLYRAYAKHGTEVAEEMASRVNQETSRMLGDQTRAILEGVQAMLHPPLAPPPAPKAASRAAAKSKAAGVNAEDAKAKAAEAKAKAKAEREAVAKGKAKAKAMARVEAAIAKAKENGVEIRIVE